MLIAIDATIVLLLVCAGVAVGALIFAYLMGEVLIKDANREAYKIVTDARRKAEEIQRKAYLDLVNSEMEARK